MRVRPIANKPAQLRTTQSAERDRNAAMEVPKMRVQPTSWAVQVRGSEPPPRPLEINGQIFPSASWPFSARHITCTASQASSIQKPCGATSSPMKRITSQTPPTTTRLARDARRKARESRTDIKVFTGVSYRQIFAGLKTTLLHGAPPDAPQVANL